MSAFRRVKTTMYVMVFRRRKPLDLAAVPDELLRAEVARRGLVVLPPVAAEALALSMARPAERAQELADRVSQLAERVESWATFAEKSVYRVTRQTAEADRLAAALAEPGIYELEELLISETD